MARTLFLFVNMLVFLFKTMLFEKQSMLIFLKIESVSKPKAHNFKTHIAPPRNNHCL